MSEHQSEQNSKMSFLFGFFGGMALVSIIIFIGVFALILGNYKSFAGEKDSTETGDSVAADTAQPTDTQDTTQTVLPVTPIKDSEYVKGNPDATIEIIEYSDFECPFCLRHNKNMDILFDEYKDKAKFVFRHFPLSFHPEAQKAAEAAECAGEQGKFWEMHDAIFEANEAEVMSVEKWKENAKNLGLDQAQFNDCLDSGKYEEKITQDMMEGQASGVEGTPGTFINGVLVKGAYPIDALRAEVENALK